MKPLKRPTLHIPKMGQYVHILIQTKQANVINHSVRVLRAVTPTTSMQPRRDWLHKVLPVIYVGLYQITDQAASPLCCSRDRIPEEWSASQSGEEGLDRANQSILELVFTSW